MSTFGSYQGSAAAPREISLSDQLYVPESGSSITKWMVCAFSSASDDLVVNLPNASSALDAGRAFAGIYSGESTVSPTGGDTQIKLQKSGVAKAYLKANTTCKAGLEAGYDPADGGYVVQITPVNRGKVVPIGRFTQTKASSASPQCVGIQLLEPQMSSGGPMSVAVADGAALTNSVAETTLGSYAIPAGFVTQVGQTFEIMARVDVTSGNATDTLTLKAYIGSTLIGETVAVDVTNGGGDIGVFKLDGVVRVVGATGKFYVGGMAGLGVPATATMRPTGTVGEATVDWTAAQTLSIKGTWSVASASNSCKLTMLTVKAGY